MMLLLNLAFNTDTSATYSLKYSSRDDAVSSPQVDRQNVTNENVTRRFGTKIYWAKTQLTKLIAGRKRELVNVYQNNMFKVADNHKKVFEIIQFYRHEQS